MSSVDNRIVNMQFNNKQFQSGASDSVQALETLEKTVEDMSGTGGLEDMGNQVDGVASRFGALQIAGVAALATIAATATQTALSLGRDLLGAITSTVFGAGAQRAIDIEQAKFQFRGLGLDVKTVMDNALTAVQGTAFGLQEAATAATQFGGSGVKAGDEMTIALRSISGIAAQTGRSYSEIAQIMTSIAGTGKLNTQDLMQFGVRGLDVTGALAEQMGKTQQQIRTMVSEGQIDFKTFASAMDVAFGENATRANRTFTGALANMKAALSRIGADFFAPQLKSARDIFNALSGVFDKFRGNLGPISEGLGEVTGALSKNIVQWLKMISIRRILEPVIEGFKNIFAPFVAILQTIGDAWLQVFPSKGHQSGRVIVTIAKAFETLTTPLAWLADQIPRITPFFVAFFEVLRIGWTIVGGLAQALSGVGDKAGEIGSSIVQGIMGGLTGEEIQAEIVRFAESIIEWIKGALGIASPAAELVPVGSSIVEGIAEGIKGAVNFIGESMALIVHAIFEGFENLFGSMDALDWAALFNAILSGAILLSLRGIVKSIGGLIEGITGTLNFINEPVKLATQSLKVMQTQVRAQLIMSIAIAIGVLTASIIALSLLDPKKAAIGLGFLAAEMALMTGMMGALSKINPVLILQVGAAIVLISGAMLVLAGAIAILGNLGMDTLAKGLGAMAFALATMVAMLNEMVALGPGLPAAAAAMAIMAVAMNILAGAIAVLGNMDLKTLVVGLFAISIGLQLFIGTLAALAPIAGGVIASSGAILIMAVAMNVLALALHSIGRIKIASLVAGLATMAIALAIFVIALEALSSIGPAAVSGAAGIFIISAAMLVLAKTLQVLGQLSIAQIATGLATLAIGLTLFLLAGAAASIGPVALGLAILAETMLIFGAGVALLGVGLLAAATAFGIFSAVFAAGTGVLVAGFTALLALLPVLAQQVALSFVLFAQTIGESMPELRKAFGQIIQGILGTIRDAIPEIRKTADVLIGSLLGVLINNTPKFGRFISVLIETGLKILRQGIPQYAATGAAIIEGVLRGIGNRLPGIIDAGTDLIIKFIQGMQQASNRIINAAADAIIDFLHGIADTIRQKNQEFRDAGLDIADAIIDGIVDAIQDGVGAVGDAMTDLANAAIDRFTSIFEILSPSKVSHWWGEMIVDGLVLGIKDNIANAVGVTIQLANAAIAAGDKVVAKAQKDARKRQIAAAKSAAKADLSERLAKQAEKVAQQSPKNKQLQQAAKEARKLADAQQKAADAAQRRADAASQKVSDVQAFRDADDQGKGDILQDRAEELTNRAIRKLAEANAAAQAAKKATGQQRKELLEEARRDAQISKRLADRAKDEQKRARDFFASAVRDRIQGIRKEQAEQEKAEKEQEEFDKATDAEKIAILEGRAEAARKRAEAEQKQAEALLKQARKLAKTDAIRAQKLLDKAERLAEKADADAEAADKSTEEAEQIAGGDGGSGGVTFELSRSALEDAASAIDRYTKSLQQAEEAAMAEAPVYQFVQNNTSPESLSDATVYRQTKNLLTAAEIKMAVPVPTG